MAAKPETEVFRKNLPTIAKAIADTQFIQCIADQLVAIEFIDDTGICATQGYTPYEKASTLLRAVLPKMTASYEDTRENFFKFTDILQSNRSLKKLGQNLLKEYESHGGIVTRPEPTTLSGNSEPRDPITFTPAARRNAFEDKQPTLQEFFLLKWRENGQEKKISIRDKVAPKWRDLGANLGFDSTQMDTIELSSLKDVSRCAGALFGEWQRKTSGYNWGMLIEALEDAKFVELARETKNALAFVYS